VLAVLGADLCTTLRDDSVCMHPVHPSGWLQGRCPWMGIHTVGCVLHSLSTVQYRHASAANLIQVLQLLWV
jgi:hypothetical protein